VAFGTGKLNENSDYSDISDRGFYSVVDKNPSTSLTVAGADLVDIVYTPPPSETRTWATPNLTGKSGWKMKFENGERILSNSTRPPDTGVVLFGTTKPAGDVCTPGNTGFIMAVNMCTGKIGDIISGSLVVGGIGIKSTGVVKVSNSYTDSGNKQAIVCNQAGCKPPDTCTDPAGCTLKLKGVIAPKGRYSWRQIFTK
jgi:type IV pilus assembly protein PilY1